MHNFYHEIALPEDKAIRKFLWISYFHDANILDFLPGQPNPHDLTLKIYSCHDGGTYLLRFHNTVHYECSARAPSYAGQSISSTVFKDSALLHRLQKEESKPLYHLRFSHWDGYTDVIFERFTIRREGGRVNYKPEFDPAALHWRTFSYAPNGYWLKSDPFVADTAHPEGDDADEQAKWVDDVLWARLYHIHQAGDANAITAQARSCLNTAPRLMHAELYAAYLLGKYGDATDMPVLMQQYLHADIPIIKRVILDAIEQLHERTRT